MAGDKDWRSKSRNRDGGTKTINGKLFARVQYVDETSGRRKEKLLPAKNKTEARVLIADFKRDLRTKGSSLMQLEKILFRDVAERYTSIHLVPAVLQNGIKVSGRRSLGPIKSSLKPLITNFGHHCIRQIRPSDVEKYKLVRLAEPVKIPMKVKVFDENTGLYRTKREEKRRPRKIASVNRELELLRAIFNFAKGEEIVDRSPFDLTSRLISNSAETERDRVLSFDEERRLLSVCVERRSHLKPLVIVAVDTGMRRGELFKLKWSDVNLDAGEIHVRASNAKTEKSRTVGLTGRATKELQSLWEVSPGSVDSLVFGVTSTVKNAWKTACRLARIDDFRFHDLRHTATTRLVRSGVPSSEVMKITGHTQQKTFLRYLSLTNESVRKSAQCLDSYLSLSNDKLASD